MREQFTGKKQELLQKPKVYNTFLVPQSRSNESSSLMPKKVILIELLDSELQVKLENLRSELCHSTWTWTFYFAFKVRRSKYFYPMKENYQCEMHNLSFGLAMRGVNQDWLTLDTIWHVPSKDNLRRTSSSRLHHSKNTWLHLLVLKGRSTDYLISETLRALH